MCKNPNPKLSKKPKPKSGQIRPTPPPRKSSPYLRISMISGTFTTIFRKDFEFSGLMALSRQKKGSRAKSIKIVLFGNIDILAPKTKNNRKPMILMRYRTFPLAKNTSGRPESSQRLKNRDFYDENVSFWWNTFSKNDPKMRKIGIYIPLYIPPSPKRGGYI